MSRSAPAVSFSVKFAHHEANKIANQRYQDALSSSSGEWIDDNTHSDSDGGDESSRSHHDEHKKKKKKHQKKHRDKHKRKHKHGHKKHRKHETSRERTYDDEADEDQASDQELIVDAEPDTGKSSINIDLNKRNTRFTIWSLAYFIFSIADFAKDVNGTNESTESKLRSGYHVWATSAFFLLIVSSIMFILSNPKYSPLPKKNKRHRGRRDPAAIIKKGCLGMLVLIALLRMVGLGLHNQIRCNDSWCGSFYFSQDLIVAGFAVVIGMDFINLFKCVKTKLRASRMMIYSGIMSLCGILEFVYYARASSKGMSSHTSDQSAPAADGAIFGNDDYNSVGPFYESGSSMLRASATGWFFIWIVMMMAWLISASVYAGNYTCRCVRQNKHRKYFHFGIAVALYTSL